jgi:tetratricopeptide (TPR) repeat protein
MRRILLRCTVRNPGWLAATLVVAVMVLYALMALPQQPAQSGPDTVTINGRVVDAQGQPVNSAVIRLRHRDDFGAVETQSDANGDFAFTALRKGSYLITAEKAGWRSPEAAIVVSAEVQRIVDLVLKSQDNVRPESGDSSGQTMEFSDRPNFTVAGVTDWTAVGGHGSDTILRTSEALARDVVTLQPERTHVAAAATGDGNSEAKLRAVLAGDPGNFDAKHRLGEFYLDAGRYAEAVPFLEGAYQIDPKNFDNTYDLALACKGTGDYSQALNEVKMLLTYRDDADLHRLIGELDEKLGDPLAAVHEYELAAKANPSEENYFVWGSELLLHRAIWQAQEVFRSGVEAYPKSESMLTGLGVALFAGAIYDDASRRLCEASDRDPSNPEPYTFMGKVEIAAPNPLPCIEPRLARFAREQPQNPTAKYLYAMAIMKSQQKSLAPEATQQAAILLQKAVELDPGCADAWLQLGILSFAKQDFKAAINDYRKAIEANPQLGEAHYRLGVAYDRSGDQAKARQEFELHDEIEKAQADAVERQRKAIQQFVIAPSGQTAVLPEQ